MITFFFFSWECKPSKFLGKSKLPKNWDRVPKKNFEKRKDGQLKLFLRSHDKFKQNIFNVIQKMLFKAKTKMGRKDKKNLYIHPSTPICSQLIWIAQLLSQPEATRVSLKRSKSMVSKFIFRLLKRIGGQ